MPLSDLSLAELERYRPEREEPADFDAFWSAALAEADRLDADAVFTREECGLTEVTVYDVAFSGCGGQRVRGWLVLPAHRDGPLPCVVEFPGYGGGRGLPHEQLLYAAAGFAHLVMDVRGQGSVWRAGATGDDSPAGGGPQHPGFMTRGIADPADYYYRRVFVDAVRAVAAARSHPAVDPGRVAVAGESQGGGLSLAVAGLVPDLAAVLPDVPFLCDLRRGAEVASTGPYREIAGYLAVHRGHVDAVFRTLSYFDAVNHAARATAPALFSAALMDTTCPPSTIFAAYHHYAAEKRMEVYPYNDHEGGGAFQAAIRLRYLRAVLGD
ncbi:acetylxylan esterase [Streptomyces sp. SID3343]|uniref:acetylxylan esterase n=1 Tax=Streptomyces sp. SID3343 TaxID=2690260 RepID=UPI00136DEBE4|nr:acetylxylan esterase [Streptomyces sp. SID3343]MYV99296.1 prolyl oligopeptidase family serine peptidase [Streptomyces sp. SID3343]